MNKSMKISITAFAVLIGTIAVQMPSYAASSKTPIIPVLKNPIVNTSTKVGFTILAAQVEDNTNPKNGVDISDRLALKVRNTSSKAISSFEIYYTMVDRVTKSSESYYQKLSNFSIPANSIGYIDFDNAKGFGHFPENKYSIYRNSKNKVSFKIELSALGLKPAYARAMKSKGTTEDPNG